MSAKEAQSRFYHVCQKCTAKWFAPVASMNCPRCGVASVTSEQIVPPWMRDEGPLPSATPASPGHSHEAKAKTENKVIEEGLRSLRGHIQRTSEERI